LDSIGIKIPKVSGIGIQNSKISGIGMELKIQNFSITSSQ
jgi:hypothetical protein